MRRMALHGVAAAIAGALVLTAAPAFAGLEFELTAPQVAWRQGDTTYQIGGLIRTPTGYEEAWFPISELKFPVNVVTLGLEGRLGVPVGFGSLSLRGGYAAGSNGDAGDMEDSDWTEAYNTDLKTIYSTSDSDLETALSDVALSWRFPDRPGKFIRWYVGVGGGYFAQHLDYEESNVRQESIYPEYRGSVPGPVLTYEVDYRVPYVEVSGGMRFGSRAGFDARLGYSAWATAEDVDDHLLRSKRAEGECDGNALLASLRGFVNLLPERYRVRLVATVGVSLLAISTEGTQTQTRYAPTDEGPPGFIAETDEEIFTGQTQIDLGLGLSF